MNSNIIMDSMITTYANTGRILFNDIALRIKIILFDGCGMHGNDMTYFLIFDFNLCNNNNNNVTIATAKYYL